MRVKDGRMGFLLVKPFALKDPVQDKKGVFVNVGWIPDGEEIDDKAFNATEDLSSLL